MIHPLTKVEKLAILSAIVESDFNVIAAARALGIGRETVYHKLRDWKIRTPFGNRRNNLGNKFKFSEFRAYCEGIEKVVRELREELAR